MIRPLAFGSYFSKLALILCRHDYQTLKDVQNCQLTETTLSYMHKISINFRAVYSALWTGKQLSLQDAFWGRYQV